MMQIERITRDMLRTMRNGAQVTVLCSDGYDLNSQRNTAYEVGRLEGCRFTCATEGLKLTVTRHDNE